MQQIFSENRAIYEKMRKSTAQADRPQMTTIRHMRFACWITKATNTQSEHITFIDFPRQQRVRERALILFYTYIVCLVIHQKMRCGYSKCAITVSN